MRFRYILPAALLTAGSAMAQAGAPIPNAVGVWNSSVFGFFGWSIGTGFPAGTAGNSMWQALPPELTTYFRAGAGGARELDFRGVEMNLTFFGAQTGPFDSPRIQVRSAAVNPVQTQRWIPGATTYVDIPSIPNFVNFGGNPAGTTARFALDLGPGNAVAVPTEAGGVGTAIMLVYQDFQQQFGDGLGIHTVSSSTEPVSGGAAALAYGGGSTNTGLNFSLPAQFEWTWTWLFEQSMIQPVADASLISTTGQILGGGPPPAPFTVTMNDGRRAIHPVAGNGVSYAGNSSYGGGAGTTWFVPFVIFSGDVTAPGVTDPNPEVWNTGGNNYIYRHSTQKWIDDFCALTAACPAGTGAILNPNNSNHAIWLGIDLPSLINVGVLLNGLAFADISAGPQWAGPSVLAFDSAVNPGGLLGRNLANVLGYIDGATGAPLTGIREHRTVLTGPQSGWTPVSVLAAPSPTLLGFGQYQGGLAGETFAINCWLLDLNTTTITDVSNVAVVRLQ